AEGGSRSAAPRGKPRPADRRRLDRPCDLPRGGRGPGGWSVRYAQSRQQVGAENAELEDGPMQWTLPNILTLARICLTPVIALLPFIDGYEPKVIALIIFMAAAVSDVVDGYLARRYKQVSELGQLLD